MTKAGKRLHQKRASAPSTWPIRRKGPVFVPKISPGPHSKTNGMPLLILLRDVLGVGQTRKEIKHILHNRKVFVDGRIRTNERFPVGHMDIVEIPEMEKTFRVQLHTSDKLLPFEIDESEKEFKICKVVGKRNMRGGKSQISLHDGRNLLLNNDDKRLPQIKGQSSLKIKVPSQEIVEIYNLAEDARAMVTEGRHRGKVGTIIEINQRYGPKASEVVFRDEKEGASEFRTALEYVFIIGPDLTLER